MERHYLRFGMATLAAFYGGESAAAITEYRVELDREYPVMVAEKDKTNPWGGTNRQIGASKVGGAPGNLFVEFETTNSSPRFYSVWHVDRGGIANLDEILMATDPYSAH